MPKYIPIPVLVPLRASESDLVAFTWRDDGVAADFVLPTEAGRVLRVSFDRPCIVRLLDEMPLSTEDDSGATVGLVSEHFAYRMEGAVFADAQSETWKTVNFPVSHYRFITGWACMDVLSSAQPHFEVVQKS